MRSCGKSLPSGTSHRPEEVIVDAIPQCEGRQGVVAEALGDRGGARFGRFFLMVGCVGSYGAVSKS